jgi:DNA replication and repair protein RecF
MSLTHLKIQNLRNLATASLNFAPGVNFVVGPNGSGKSSLLEAVGILSRGKSFRTNQLRQVTARGQESFTLFGRVGSRHAGSEDTPIGFEYSLEGGTRGKIGFENVRRISELAGVFPVSYIGPEVLGLFAGAPQERRVVLDWGLFHVEQAYLTIYQRYARALKQRNAALRVGAVTDRKLITAWDAELADSGEALTATRRIYLSELQNALNDLLPKLLRLPVSHVELRFGAGWRLEQDSLRDALTRSLERDLVIGATQVGPHRADFRLYINGEPAKNHLSGGQMKVAVCAFVFAQIRHAVLHKSSHPTLLIDDLPAELDYQHRGFVIDELAKLPCQIIAASTETSLVCLEGFGLPEKMFHVEHGTFAELA